jgi:hypothetical protein
MKLFCSFLGSNCPNTNTGSFIAPRRHPETGAAGEGSRAQYPEFDSSQSCASQLASGMLIAIASSIISSVKEKK